ncbi:hypothetical protein N0V90_005501 [Kalmusia sp. IMI 367209]|nr:hypothetical protein N0V90_005501 [Kalmusia sp. IMI 367209]
MSAADLLQLPPFDASDSKTYNALCHCGTVQYNVTLSPPLERQKIVECNCSICSRNGYLLVYPKAEQFKVTSGQEALKTYTFGPKMNLHYFCGRCGSAVFFDPQLPKRGETIDIRGVNRFTSSQATATPNTSAAPPKPRRSRLLYIWYGIVLFGGVSAGLTIRNFVSPSLPVPGSREDELALAALTSDVEQLDIVKYMRSQCYHLHEDSPLSGTRASGHKGWIELGVKTHIAESKDDVGKKTRTITEDALAGSKGLGVQRAFWNAETRELVAVVWLGTALSGWPMLAHGGAIATVFEDCMSKMVAGPDATIDSIEQPTSMSITYAKPTYSTNFYILRANYSRPNFSQVAPPHDPDPAPAKSWLPSWKDFTKKEQPTNSKKAVEIIGTLESVDGELLVRVKGTFPVSG